MHRLYAHIRTLIYELHDLLRLHFPLASLRNGAYT